MEEIKASLVIAISIFFEIKNEVSSSCLTCCDDAAASSVNVFFFSNVSLSFSLTLIKISECFLFRCLFRLDVLKGDQGFPPVKLLIFSPHSSSISPLALHLHEKLFPSSLKIK